MFFHFLIVNCGRIKKIIDDMKNFLLILSLTLTLAISSCSSDEPKVLQEQQSHVDISKFSISRSEALAIADDLLGCDHELSRSATASVLPILQGKNRMLPDTLAYVINYADNGGFAIIAGDNRIDPVLAYSDDGSFSMQNECAVENFINRLEGYVSSKASAVGPIITPMDPLTYYRIPIVKSKFNQSKPFNKYLSEIYSNPNILTGCCPLAVGTVMMYSSNSVTLRNQTFDLQRIRNGLQTNDSEQPRFSYDIAAYEASKLFAMIGLNLSVQYDKGVYEASGYAGLMQLIDNGFLTPIDYYTDDLSWNPTDFTIDKAVELLDDGCILYAWAPDKNLVKTGHAWVIDGYLCSVYSSGKRENHMVHCCWGWNGSADGYYKGEVFNPTDNAKYETEAIEIGAFYHYNRKFN